MEGWWVYHHEFSQNFSSQKRGDINKKNFEFLQLRILERFMKYFSTKICVSITVIFWCFFNFFEIWAVWPFLKTQKFRVILHQILSEERNRKIVGMGAWGGSKGSKCEQEFSTKNDRQIRIQLVWISRKTLLL